MDSVTETRLTASLPQLDIEITRSEPAEGGAEILTISLRAQPGFEAVAQSLLPAMMMMPQMLASGMTSPMMAPMMTINPFTAWMSLMSQAGAALPANPWLDMWKNVLPGMRG